MAAPPVSIPGSAFESPQRAPPTAEELISECLTSAILAGDVPERVWPAWFHTCEVGSEFHESVVSHDAYLQKLAKHLLEQTWNAYKQEFPNKKPNLHDVYMRAAYLLQQGHKETVEEAKEAQFQEGRKRKWMAAFYKANGWESPNSQK